MRHHYRERREQAEALRRQLKGGNIQVTPPEGTNRIVGIVEGGHMIQHTVSDIMPMRGGELLNQISFRQPVAKKPRENIRFVF